MLPNEMKLHHTMTNNATPKKLRWGILGCSVIGKAVVPSIQQSEHNVVVAIASRDLAKAERAAQTFGIAKAYGSYDELLNDTELDAVYIPLPNHLHKLWTIRAARAGKHVLCEKPMALSAQEAEEMAEACRQAGVLLREAFMYRHHPRYDMIRNSIARGEIGELRAVRSVFTFNNTHRSGISRHSKEMGGGGLYDVGCYPIHAARMLIGHEPIAVTMHALFSDRHDGVDMMADGLVEFPGSIALSFTCGMWAARRNSLELIGTTGIIDIPSAFVSNAKTNSNFYISDNETRREIVVPEANHYSLQADSFAEALFAGKPLPEADDAVRNMRVVDACLESARTHRRIVL